MSESEIIRVEQEALKKICQGNRQKALEMIQRYGGLMRDYVDQRAPGKVTSQELCAFIIALDSLYSKGTIHDYRI